MTDFYAKYELVVGLEVHIQLNTARKIFAPDATNFDAAANENTSYISLAHPGTLPMLNKEVINKAIMLGYATNAQFSDYCFFDRKNYFYPDLPKSYQITQDNQPICKAGFVEVFDGKKYHAVQLNRIHIEEDAGKSLHDQDEQFSYIDLNRAGVPLLELVTEPCIHQSDIAYHFLNELHRLVMFLQICDGNMEEGSFRCDANISVRPRNTTTFGERVEIKNMNSMRFVKKAIDYEFERQCALLEKGEKIARETRGYNAENNTTFSQRSKEEAHDYRYFPEPDLIGIVLTQAHLQNIKAQMLTLPQQWIRQFTEKYALSYAEADLLCENAETVTYFNALVSAGTPPKMACNWLLNKVKSYIKENNLNMEQFPVPAEKLAEIIALVADGKVNDTQAKTQLFEAVIAKPRELVKDLAQKMRLIIENNDNFVEKLIAKIIEESPEEVKVYRSGKKQIAGVLMGKLMKQSGGRIKPDQAHQLLIETLNNL
ncbi:MAG: Asp-tRNA(Asn)/Glu-tRNA(Gln) amidotransferase subunit GatB [Chitinophagales bacterium]|nr:Asp-tRNA(Asn)/Glu-tRNA(Gln) amidotransferase subunit GatB [Bacteroidota bacterium]MCB9043189.1 Asp-tRNA(Asn)/Glu-tRNA(Gln) amidotransferase subunit GatB [Chitinophagales bacterium]